MHVRRIEDPHVKKVAAVIEELLRRTGKMPGLMFIAEDDGQFRYGIVGRFRSDPAKAIGHLAIMQEKVTSFAADQAPDIDRP